MQPIFYYFAIFNHLSFFSRQEILSSFKYSHTVNFRASVSVRLFFFPLCPSRKHLIGDD